MDHRRVCCSRSENSRAVARSEVLGHVMHTRRVISLVVALAVGVGSLCLLALEFRSNDPIGYFTRYPLELLTVAALAVVTGLGVAVFVRLPKRNQRLLRLAFLATLGIAVSAFAVYAGVQLVSLRRSAVEAQLPQVSMWILLWPVACASLCWLEFWRTWRRAE